MRIQSCLLVVLSVVFVAALTTAGADVASAPRSTKRGVPVHSAKFTVVPPGWKAFDDDFGVLTRRGAEVESYALSWPYAHSSLGWGDAMPRGAVAVSVHLGRRAAAGRHTNLCAHVPELAGFPPLRPPLSLPRTTRHTFEGRPEVPEYRLQGRIGTEYNVDLRVDVNSRHPSRATLKLARRVVAGLHLPQWPSRTTC